MADALSYVCLLLAVFFYWQYRTDNSNSILNRTRMGERNSQQRGQLARDIRQEMERDLMKQEAQRNVRMLGDDNNIFDRTVGGGIALKKPSVPCVSKPGEDRSKYNNDLYKKYKLSDSYDAADKTHYHTTKRVVNQ